MLATRLGPADSRSPATWPSQSIEPLLPELRERVRFLVETAVANKSTISVGELRSLMPENRFPSDGALKQFLVTDERLSRLVAEINGEITLRGREDLANHRRAQRRRAHDRLSQADDFLHTLGKMCPRIALATSSIVNSWHRLPGSGPRFRRSLLGDSERLMKTMSRVEEEASRLVGSQTRLLSCSSRLISGWEERSATFVFSGQDATASASAPWFDRTATRRSQSFTRSSVRSTGRHSLEEHHGITSDKQGHRGEPYDPGAR